MPHAYVTARVCALHMQDAIMGFAGFGGIRIEDNILITESGTDNLTGLLVPRTVADIEAVMGGAPWPLAG